MTETVCVLCGRKGTRAFIMYAGDGDGTRDSWCCENTGACERRREMAQRAAEYRAGIPGTPEWEANIKRIVAEAPPLTPRQIDAIVTLLGPAIRKRIAERQ